MESLLQQHEALKRGYCNRKGSGINVDKPKSCLGCSFEGDDWGCFEFVLTESKKSNN